MRADRWSLLREDRQWLEALQQYREERHERAEKQLLMTAESDHHHFATAFHLKQLLKTHPEDADLKSRLATAEKYLPHWRLDFDAHKAETANNWKSAIPLLEALAKHYPTDDSITARLQKAKEEATNTAPEPQPPRANSP